MTHHPHIHMIVPGGGVALDGKRWLSCRPRFLLPVQVLSLLFRRLLLQKLRAAHKAGQLQFFGQHAHLAEPKAFAAYLAPLRKIEWYLYLKSPFGGPEAVLAYLSRYTHRVAIANSRLIAFDENGVTFRYKDYRADGRARYKSMTLATDEFIRRFLIHVLPHGFHRIRHYGLFANGNRAANIARARELLAVPSRLKQPEMSEPAVDEPRVLPRPCPCCGGRMIIIETFARGSSRSTAPHRPRSRSGSIPHDLVTADRQPPRHSLFRPPRRRQCSSSYRSARSARSRTTNATRGAVRSFTVVRSSDLRANTIAASAPIQTTHASRRGQIPIACTAPPAHHRSRFRALALFGRRPIERVTAIAFTGIQKPAQSTKHKTGHSVDIANPVALSDRCIVYFAWACAIWPTSLAQSISIAP